MEIIKSFKDENRFLSNFYKCNIEYEKITYSSVEYAYQAAKSLDIEERKFIAAIATPGLVKKAGKNLTIREDWEEVKLLIMEELLKKKFEHTDLREKLLATGSKELIEGNYWHDTYWGVYNGEGENHLGKLLMKIRDTL